MKTLYIATLSAIVLFTMACSEGSQTVQTAKLLFKSGFEGKVYMDSAPVKDSEEYHYIRGKDTESGFSWPLEILGSSESALHAVDDDGGDALETSIVSTTGHTGKQTKVLYTKENYDATGATQYPYEILNIQDGRKDLYVRYWMKIDSRMLGEKNKWRAFLEYKTKDYKDPGENGTGFRLISYLYTDEEGRASWHFQGDKDSEHSLWECDTLTPTASCNNSVVPVITDKWFLTEYYWHWSNGNDGIARWKINGKIVGEHHGPTTRYNNPIDFIMLTQIYGDSNPKEQWIDDIEIWGSEPKMCDDNDGGTIPCSP